MCEFTRILKRVKWIAIEEILHKWASCDSSDIDLSKDREKIYAAWQELLQQKRNDYCYTKTKETIEKEGFRIPLGYSFVVPEGKKKSRRKHSNGHHRLTAAFDLGYKYVPYIFERESESFYSIKDYIDAGLDLQPLIHPENPPIKN